MGISKFRKNRTLEINGASYKYKIWLYYRIDYQTSEQSAVHCVHIVGHLPAAVGDSLTSTTFSQSLPCCFLAILQVTLFI